MNNCYYAIGGLLFSGEHILASIFDQNKNINLSYIRTEKLVRSKSPLSSDSKPKLEICTNWAFMVNYESFQHELCNKLIVTVRKTPDIAAHIAKYFCSYYMDYNKLKMFLSQSEEIQQLKKTYINLHELYSKYKDDLIVIEHDDIINNPQNIIDKIHKMLNLDPFNYNLDFLKYYEKLDAKQILGPVYDDFDQQIFWDDKQESAKLPKEIDIQLKLAIEGKFDEALKIVNKMEVEQPLNDRAAFNRGWFKMRDGKLLEGHQLLDRGRIVRVFGNPVPKLIKKPVWDGESKSKVLYYTEGGFGDQIHAIKYVNRIKQIASDVSICCSNELKNLLIENNYTNVFGYAELQYIDYDYWVPAMSVITVLGYEYKDLDGKPYLQNKRTTNNKKFTVGLKWSGNPEFEHHQHRKFPADLFFNSVYNDKFDFVSLQRDNESELCPDWVQKVKLDDWIDTQTAVSNCDLVISSCTSVAHLSAAIGVPTWIAIPILPYYLWALPGDKTVHYDSVTLFRQEVFNDWTHPFAKIKEKLKQYEG